MQGSWIPGNAVIVGEDSVRSPTVWTAACEDHWNNHYDMSKDISGAPSWMSPRRLHKKKEKKRKVRTPGKRYTLEMIQSQVPLFGQQRQGSLDYG